MQPAITYRFVGPGSVVSDQPPFNELWLDVGGRIGLRVLDHHGGDTDAWCSAQLVVEHFEELLLAPLRDVGAVTLVLHNHPGLDGIVSSWLARKILESGDLPQPRHAVAAMVQAVAEHDQGFLRTDDPSGCWPLVVRLSIATHPGTSEDLAEIECGFGLVERSFEALAGSRLIGDVARGLITPTVRAIIAHGERDYAEDLTRAQRFQVRLPVRLLEPWLRTCENTPQNRPDPTTERWSLADGLFLDEPASTLFRELARGDRHNSPGGQGFALMVVSRDLETSHEVPLHRHVISTDPMSGLHLLGLGKELEELEQKHEQALGLDPPPGRERVPAGEGRHGYNVPSPWYDGRGHAFTIVDSPLVKIGDDDVCGSLLTSREVLDAVWKFGDPLSFLGIDEAHLTIFQPVSLLQGWRELWQEASPLVDLCPELCTEILEADSAPHIYRRKGHWDLSQSRAIVVEQQLWLIEEELGLWVAVVQLADTKEASVLARTVAELRRRGVDEIAPEGFHFDLTGETYHLVQCRVRPSEVSLEDDRGPSALATHLLAEGRPSGFHSLADDRQMDESERAFSRDRTATLCCTARGAVALSTQSTNLDDQSGFSHRESMASLVALFLSRKQRLQRLSARFTLHRGESNPMRGAKLILDDQWELIRLDQDLSTGRISDRTFGQRSYEALADVHHFSRLLDDTKKRIETLAQHVRDTKAAFFQRVGLWVSVLFAPLAITASLFSGTHLQRRFAETNLSFLPDQLQPAGWFDFLLVFVVLSLALSVLWLLMRLAYGRESSLQRGQRRPPPP